MIIASQTLISETQSIIKVPETRASPEAEPVPVYQDTGEPLATKVRVLSSETSEVSAESPTFQSSRLSSLNQKLASLLRNQI